MTTKSFRISIGLLTLTIVLASSAASTANSAVTLEKVKLIASTGIENFVKDLNDNGNLGYRLEKSLSYGGEGAAVIGTRHQM